MNRAAMGERAADEPPSLARRVLPKLLLSLVLGGILAFVVQRSGVNIIPEADSFAHVTWWTVPAYVGVLLVTHFFRASRWRYLVEPVKDDIPFWDGVLLNWIGFFAIFALPLRLGELARPALTKIRHRVSISAGLGTVAVERVIDGLVASVCVLWALLALPQREHVTDPIALSLPYYATVAVGVFVAAFAGLLLFLWQRAFAVKLIHWTFGRLSKRLGELLSQKVADVAEGVRSVSEPRLAGGFLFETILYWGTNALGMWLLAWGCGIDMTFGFPELIAHAARTRRLCAGTILGSGTVSNTDRSAGSSCLAEVRMIETLEQGAPVTPFLDFGDTVRIEMTGEDGDPLFGAIDQRLEQSR